MNPALKPGALQKPRTGKRMRTRPTAISKRQSADLRYAAKVRARVAERDEVCRLMLRLPPCRGELMWCHMEGKRRHQTRRMKPENRHGTAWTVMLCARHAEMEERHQIRTDYLTERGADGPMAFMVEPNGPTILELDVA